jgi:hypothetical protein
MSACLAFFFETVAIAPDVNNGGTVQEAIQSGAGHYGVVCKDLSPIRERIVAGQDDGPAIALADDLEQQRSLRGVQSQRAHLV